MVMMMAITPFATAWMGDNHFAPLPVAAYGGVLFLLAISFTILVRALIRRHGPQSTLARAVGGDRKGLTSLALYGAAVPLAFVNRWISLGLYVTVAIIWLVPDSRIERVLMEHSTAPSPADT